MIKAMKKLITTTALLVFVLFVASSSYATRLDDLIIQKDSQLNGLLLELLAAGANLDDPRLNTTSELAESICMAAGITGCSRGSFNHPDSVAEAICMAAGIIGCSRGSFNHPDTITEALEMVPIDDRFWYWDQFRDQYGNNQWRCRGSQTGQFATDSQCSAVAKDDERWPGPNP